ncbi:C25 family cysteine peptidase [Neorhodopirellula pilleata]|nr:C25 family cysteine peptidase [Neorhodopirellula pilleata]
MMHHTSLFLTALAIIAFNLTGWRPVRGEAHDVDAHDVIVVCHEALRESLQPWTDHRIEEGLTIGFCEPQSDAKSTAEDIRTLAGPSTRYVLIVGDAPPVHQSNVSITSNPLWIPTFYQPSPVTRKYGSTESYPTDLPYVDFDADGTSDASIGRLPVTTPEQLAGIVQRILAFETSDDFGPWRQCLQLTAGVGGFGGLIDGAIEAVTRTVLTSALPADVKPQIAYASPGHAFCPTDSPFQECVMQRYREGARFWIYAGHGSVDRLDLLKRAPDDADGIRQESTATPWEVESLLKADSVSLLKSEPTRPTIGLLLACYAGAFDAAVPCLAERMLLTPGGPIAMISASRLTMPYGNAKFGLSLLESVYDLPATGSAGPVQPPTVRRIGDAMLAAQRTLQSEQAGSTTQVMLDGVATLISPAGNDLKQERREHAGLYQLLGDPTLHLHRSLPVSIKAKVSSTAKEDATKTVNVEFSSPLSGTITLSIDRPLGGSSQQAGVAGLHDPHGSTVVQKKLSVREDENVTTEISLPIDFNGPVIVRGFVESESGWATGSAKAYIRP